MADEPTRLPLSTEFRLGVDLVNQLPGRNWNTPSPLQRAPWPTYMAEQSVRAPAAPNLAMYVRAWQHGDKPASPELRAAMLSNGVLPSASRPETNFTIGHVNYTAMFRLIGRPDEIIVRQADTLLPRVHDTILGGVRGRDHLLPTEDKDSIATRRTDRPPRSPAYDMEYMTVDGDVRHSLKPALPHLRSLTSDGQELQSVGPRPLMMGRRRMDTYLDDARIINIDSYINYNLSSLINSSGLNGVEIRGTPQQLHNYEDIVARDHERAKGFVRFTIQKLEAYLDPVTREDVEQDVRAALGRYFGIAGTSKQDVADIREILANYRKVHSYLNRDEPLTRAQRLKAWFVDFPLYRIRPKSNGTLAYVRGGPIHWPDWRIVPRSLRSRSVSSGWSGLGLFLAGVSAYQRGVATLRGGRSVEERYVERAAALGAVLFGGFATSLIGGSYGVNKLRRLTSESGINLHEGHFAYSDRFRSSTVVHEATHLLLGTDDHAYEHEPRFGQLSTTQHITNADSYGRFAERVSRS